MRVCVCVCVFVCVVLVALLIAAAKPNYVATLATPAAMMMMAERLRDPRHGMVLCVRSKVCFLFLYLLVCD